MNKPTTARSVARGSSRVLLAAAVVCWVTPLAAADRGDEPLLLDAVQLTTRERFVKAGEAYFDHRSPPEWVIFQATAVPATGEAPSPHYAMYVARLKHEGGRIVGIDEPIEISSAGSASTCGWFHPTDPARMVYATTLGAPAEAQAPGYQRGSGRYRWEFPREMRVVEQTPHALWKAYAAPGESSGVGVCGNTFLPKVLAGEGNGYTAECSLSADGMTLLYAKMVDVESRDLDLFVKDLASGEERRIVQAPGYDGGPFFSPDGRYICYRSDRAGDSKLQIYIGELERDEQGRVIGLARERALTADGHVNWGPFWHPSGRYLVYATSRMGHTNYEVFAVEADMDKPLAELRTARVTNAAGADVLPAFSRDGRWMMWTGQRGPMVEGETRPSSQVWVARFEGDPFEEGAAGDGPAGEQADSR